MSMRSVFCKKKIALCSRVLVEAGLVVSGTHSYFRLNVYCMFSLVQWTLFWAAISFTSTVDPHLNGHLPFTLLEI